MDIALSSFRFCLILARALFAQMGRCRGVGNIWLRCGGVRRIENGQEKSAPIPPCHQITDFLPFVDILKQFKDRIVKSLGIGYGVRSREDG